MKKTRIMIFLATFLLVSMVSATTYVLNPMNFQPGTARNHTITISSPGDTINVSVPPEFTLISGSPDGVNSINVIVESPDNASNGDLFYFNISLNGTYYDNLIALTVPDDEIVDTKWELGHGNFNYPECQYLPDQESLIFPIIRVWGVGTDLLGESAQNVTMTCNYPKIRPRTVDSKFTTDYTDPNNFIATGLLDSMEGISLFRIFVLSQEADYSVGDNYEVTCSNLEYSFSNHIVNASIDPINISIVDEDPFVVTTTAGSNYVTYSIYHNGSYEVRDLEFMWQLDNNQVHREKKDVMEPGDLIIYRIWVNDNPTIDFEIRQKPCWMFNSRDPTYYTHSQSEAFVVNSNTTVIFSVEEAIYYKQVSAASDLKNIVNDLDDLTFLFKINQEDYYLEASILPASQQNEPNMTCYRLALQSNGFVQEPDIRLITNATSEDQIIVKNEEFLTREYGFTIDTDGFGVVTWDETLGICTEDNVNNNFQCPITYNYICLGPGITFKKEEIVPVSTSCILCREKVEEIGAIVSPTFPLVGFGIIVAIILLIVYMYLYYQDELDVSKWIKQRRQTREREKYLKWKEAQERNQGRLF